MHMFQSLRRNAVRWTSLALSASLVAGGALAPTGALAATRAELDNPDLIVSQGGESGTCTLAAATTMLRRAAFLNGDAGWMGVTKNAVRSVAWYPGLPWYFEFRGMVVEHDRLPAGDRISVLMKLLAEHPEGYVLYAGYTSWPHAVVVVDCIDGELQVVEPFDGSVVPLSESELVSAYNADSYWYVSSAVTPPSDDGFDKQDDAPVAQADDVAGTWFFEDGTWRYERDGEPSVGWDFIDGSWFLFDDEGSMLTGWQIVGSSWYYLLESGHMHAGWLADGDDWYYLDGSGAMARGWRLFGDTWYYMGADGRMLTGLQAVGDETYLFDDSGAMLTGWQLVDDVLSYFDEDGAMQRDVRGDDQHLSAMGVSQ